MKALSLLACMDDPPSDDRQDSGLSDHGAAVATANADYTAGALTTVSPDGDTVLDHATLASDSSVTSSGGWVFALNRVDNSVRVYAPGLWEGPHSEFAVGVNPQQALICQDKLFVVLYGEDHIGVYDVDSGALEGTVDLTSYEANGDDSPEASSAVVLDDTLYVGLENMDATWTGTDGLVVAVDCGEERVVASWPVGGNASVGLAGETLVASWGMWYTPDYSPAIDGEVGVLDPQGGFTPKLSEQALGLNLHGVAFNAQGYGVLVATSGDGSDSTSVHCVDLQDWSVTKLADLDEYVSDAVASPEGEVWLALRPHWQNGGAWGLARVDPRSCSFVGERIVTSLPPSALAFY